MPCNAEPTKSSKPVIIRYRRISALKPHPNNPRRHTKKQIQQIAKSLKKFGFCRPVLVDENLTILAGAGVVSAAKSVGMEFIPTVTLEGLTPADYIAYVIADNKLAENSSWGPNLVVELQNLLLPESGVDIELTGFEMGEIDLMIEESQANPDPGDDFSSDESGLIVSRLGDLWLLDQHRVFCGSALEIPSYEILMRDRLANAVFSDPPYNVRIAGNVSGNGSVTHREFAMASGEMADAEFVTFLSSTLRLLSRYSAAGSLHYICIDWRHASNLMAAGDQIYDSLLNVCVWVKDNGGMGSFYRSQHEFVFVYRNGKSPHRNNVQLGKFGRNRTNVWRYPCANSFSRRGDEGNLLALHPTVKPVALVADALQDSTARGDLILDTFLGSGTSLLAAERVGRTCYGMELDPQYVDVIVRRWQRYTGASAIHAVTGMAFDERETQSAPLDLAADLNGGVLAQEMEVHHG